MSEYRKTFPKKHTLLVVIHVVSEKQALENATIAFDEGADGIFVIQHQEDANLLAQSYNFIKCRYPSNWIGVNLLGMRNADALRRACTLEASGLWVDDVGYRENIVESNKKVVSLWRKHFHRGVRNLLLFGGVAFKYKRVVNDVAQAALAVKDYVDVVTTSGDGTAIAADPDKIITMKKAIGDAPLAIASGITPENVHEYKNYADCFIVASGISNTFTQLNPKLVKQLVYALR